MLHAERVIQTSLEAFVVRLYRQANLVRMPLIWVQRSADTDGKTVTHLARPSERLSERVLGRTGEL